MKVMRKIIQIDDERCDGCGQCVPSCAEGAIEIIDGKAHIVSEKYCDGLGACLGECPNDALTIVEREADDFDEEAVEEYLKDKTTEGKELSAPAGCSSAQLKTFQPSFACRDANEPKNQTGEGSALTHWPIQIHLVPPTAPFLKGADLLIAADCTAVAYPRFHQDLLKGKVVILGCPKFDDADAYFKKFKDIFNIADINSITVASMEVPCCSGLPMMVKRAVSESGKKIPFKKIVISAQGEILNEKMEGPI